jgi:hypothetical protein
MADENYTVVWSPLMQVEAEKARQRTPSEVEAEPHRKPMQRKLHPTSRESQAVIDTRRDWQRENQAIRTSGLPRGEPIKA